jgi:DNA-binding IclR family transcriptional regulator
MPSKMAASKEVPRKVGGGLYIVPAVKKAFKIVEMMAAQNRGYKLSAVARECGLPVSTANVLLHSLRECGYLQRSENGVFFLTTKLFTEGNKLIRQVQLYDVAFPEMQRLSRITDFSINLAIPDRFELIYVRIIQGRGDIQVQSHVGLRRAFHQAATGKVMLAFFSEERVKEIVDTAGLPAITKQTITSYHLLTKELEAIRAQGYAMDNEESGKNLWGIAAPIFDHQRNVVAALGVAGTLLSPAENAKFLITEARKSALTVSRSLAYESKAPVRSTEYRMERKGR